MKQGRDFDEKIPEKEIAEYMKHESVHEMFEKQQEEYHQHTLMKPKFDDFRLRFEGPHPGHADNIKSTETSEEEANPIKASADGSIDFQRIARERDEQHALYKAKHFDEEHPKDVHGGRFTYDGQHIEE